MESLEGGLFPTFYKDYSTIAALAAGVGSQYSIITNGNLDDLDVGKIYHVRPSEGGTITNMPYTPSATANDNGVLFYFGEYKTQIFIQYNAGNYIVYLRLKTNIWLAWRRIETTSV